MCGIIVCVMEFGGNLEGERTRLFVALWGVCEVDELSVLVWRPGRVVPAVRLRARTCCVCVCRPTVRP